MCTSHLKQWALALLLSATACASLVALELLEAAQQGVVVLQRERRRGAHRGHRAAPVCDSQ
eukprot:scaffold72014_cov66-Phaeocystis_antarctica.AAC.2